MTIVKKSDYLWYTVGNVDKVPEVTGVYAFLTMSKRWLYVGSAGAGRPRGRIGEHWRAIGWPDVYYFRWFQTDSEDSARATQREWIEKYKPKYNEH